MDAGSPSLSLNKNEKREIKQQQQLKHEKLFLNVMEFECRIAKLKTVAI